MTLHPCFQPASLNSPHRSPTQETDLIWIAVLISACCCCFGGYRKAFQGDLRCDPSEQKRPHLKISLRASSCPSAGLAVFCDSLETEKRRKPVHDLSTLFCFHAGLSPPPVRDRRQHHVTYRLQSTWFIQLREIAVSSHTWKALKSCSKHPKIKHKNN